MPIMTRSRPGLATRRILPAYAAVAGLLAGPVPVAAQPPVRLAAEVPYLPFAPVAPDSGQHHGAATETAPARTDDLRKRDQDLEGIRAEQKKAIDTETRLRREIQTIGDDRRKLNQQLIDTGTRIRAAEDQVAGIEERLKPLDQQERTLRESLAARRAVMAEVLAALQRIGRHPPPALMVNPQDALQSVRSAMMLGAVLPEMRQETELLLADLSELARTRQQIDAEHEELTRSLAALADERQRLGALVEQRQKQQTDTEQALEAERQRIGELARAANNLKDLITRLDQDAVRPGRSRQVLRESRTEPADLCRAQQSGPSRSGDRVCVRKGLLPLPVNGSESRNSVRPTGSAGPKKGSRSGPVRGPKSPPRATVGWFMPGPSAIMANS